MSERYYVVSEKELQNVIGLRALLSSAPAYEAGKIRTEYLEAEAACRAREVPSWATHFARACPRNLEELVFDSSEEIKR